MSCLLPTIDKLSGLVIGTSDFCGPPPGVCCKECSELYHYKCVVIDQL